MHWFWHDTVIDLPVGYGVGERVGVAVGVPTCTHTHKTAAYTTTIAVVHPFQQYSVTSWREAPDGGRVGCADGVVAGLAVGALVRLHLCPTALKVPPHPATHMNPGAQSHIQFLPSDTKHPPPSPLSQPCVPSLHGWRVGAVVGFVDNIMSLGARVGDVVGYAEGVNVVGVPVKQRANHQPR